MDNETIKILEEQVGKLPKEVIDFLSSSDWEEMLNTICSSFNLTSEISNKLKREVVLVLAGLIHPDDFRGETKGQIGGDRAMIDSLVAEIEKKIFAPIRTDLAGFFEKQEARENVQEELEKKEVEQAPNQALAKTWEKIPDVAPDNLPVGEMKNEEIDGKEPESEEKEAGTHPFEEKMKKVFTGASTTIGDLVIETPVPEKNVLVEDDPYREPIV